MINTTFPSIKCTYMINTTFPSIKCTYMILPFLLSYKPRFSEIFTEVTMIEYIASVETSWYKKCSIQKNTTKRMAM